MKEYLPVTYADGERKIDANTLKVEVSYSLGGMNLFTYKNESRGYYLHVSPVSRSDVNGIVMESYTFFSGTKSLLLACNRQSKKRALEAESIALTQREMLINHVLQENGLKLVSQEISA